MALKRRELLGHIYDHWQLHSCTIFGETVLGLHVRRVTVPASLWNGIIVVGYHSSLGSRTSVLSGSGLSSVELSFRSCVYSNTGVDRLTAVIVSSIRALYIYTHVSRHARHDTFRFNVVNNTYVEVGVIEGVRAQEKL